MQLLNKLINLLVLFFEIATDHVTMVLNKTAVKEGLASSTFIT